MAFISEHQASNRHKEQGTEFKGEEIPQGDVFNKFCNHSDKSDADANRSDNGCKDVRFLVLGHMKKLAHVELFLMPSPPKNTHHL